MQPVFCRSLVSWINRFPFPLISLLFSMDSTGVLCMPAVYKGFPGGSSGKEPASLWRRHKRWGFNPWLGKIPWSRQGNLLQYFSLENLMNRGAWRATVHGVPKSWTQLKRLSRLALYIRYRVFKHLGCSTERGMVFASLTCLYFLDKNNSKQPFK